MKTCTSRFKKTSVGVGGNLLTSSVIGNTKMDCVTIMCWNDKLSWMMSFCSQKNCLLKISKSCSKFLNFIYLVALNLLHSKQPTQLIVQLNSSLWHIIVTLELPVKCQPPALSIMSNKFARLTFPNSIYIKTVSS